MSGPARRSHPAVALLGAAAARPAGHGPSAPGSGPRPGPAAAMALKMVKGSIDRMFDKNLQDLVRGIRNHKEDEVSGRRAGGGGGGEGAAAPGSAVPLGPARCEAAADPRCAGQEGRARPNSALVELEARNASGRRSQLGCLGFIQVWGPAALRGAAALRVQDFLSRLAQIFSLLLQSHSPLVTRSACIKSSSPA